MSKILEGTEVISALATKIRNGFDTTEIQAVYKDTPIQDILKPCIFLNMVSTIQLPGIKNRSNRNYTIDIIVTGADTNTELYTWLTQINEKLLRVVDTITISGQTVRMVQGEANIEADELHLIVTYNFDVIKYSDDENVKMRTRKFEGRVI